MARIGVFASRQWPAYRRLLKHEEEIRKYKDELGLNMVVLGALPADDAKDPELRRARFLHSTEASSVRVPPAEVQAMNPFPEGLRERIGPGAHFVRDDGPLRRAIELFKQHEIECWLVTLAWEGSGAFVAPELMARDLDGARVDAAMFCPSNAAVNAWFEAYLPYLLGEYGVDGIFFTHTRYPANLAMQRACGCEACRHVAAELELDVEHDWLATRAAILARQIERIAGSVKAMHPDATFAIQSLFPSLALQLGQRPEEGFQGVDQVVYMLSYVKEVAVPMLDSLVGDADWEDPYEQFLSDEITKAVEMTPSNGAMIGLRGNPWPKEAVDRLRAGALSAGATGVVHQTYRLPWTTD